jgi:hypothetical protein
MASFHLLLCFSLLLLQYSSSVVIGAFLARQTSNLQTATLVAPPTRAYLTTGFSTTGYPTTPPSGCYNSRCMDCLSGRLGQCTGFYGEVLRDPTAELGCVCLTYDYCAMWIDNEASFFAFVSWRNMQCPTSFYPTSSPSFYSPAKGAFPSCADECAQTIVRSNLLAGDCFSYRPDSSVDCSCMYYTSCSVFCTSSDSSSFSLWENSFCSSFKSIYPTGIMGPDLTTPPKVVGFRYVDF